jgi:dihydroorotase
VSRRVDAPSLLVRGGRLFDPGRGLDAVGDLRIEGGVVRALGGSLPDDGVAAVIEADGRLVTPAFTDLHVHLREPGGEASETIATGTAAALAGGFATVLAMPNTTPAADRPEVLRYVRDAAARAGPCEVVPVSAITRDLRGRELVDFEAQVEAGALAFSDDGAWVGDDAVAREAFRRAGEAGLLLMEHCEDFGLTGPGLLHDAPATRAFGVPGIPRSAEDRATARDVGLAEAFGARLHLCHVSTAGAVGLLADAKARGLAVTGEATPHHLVLTVEDAVRGGPDFKMKPPLRDPSDTEALVRALEAGVIDAIGTDHAPHAAERKAAGLARAPFGCIGMETAFPVLFTRLVLPGRLSLRRLVEALVVGPARVLRREAASLREGAPARIAVLDLEGKRAVDRSRLQSRSRNCPFHGWELVGWPVATIVGTTWVDHAGVSS